MEDDRETIICKGLIGLFVVIIFTCIIILVDTKGDYASAMKKATSTHHSYSYSSIEEANKIIIERNACAAAIVLSGVGIIVCCFELHKKKIISITLRFNVRTAILQILKKYQTYQKPVHLLC